MTLYQQVPDVALGGIATLSKALLATPHIFATTSSQYNEDRTSFLGILSDICSGVGGVVRPILDVVSVRGFLAFSCGIF